MLQDKLQRTFNLGRPCYTVYFFLRNLSGFVSHLYQQCCVILVRKILYTLAKIIVRQVATIVVQSRTYSTLFNDCCSLSKADSQDIVLQDHNYVTHILTLYIVLLYYYKLDHNKLFKSK